MAANADFEEFDLTQRIQRLREEEVRLKQSVSSKEQYHKRLKDECDESSGIREKIRANIKELERHENALNERVASTNEAIQELSRGLPDERLKEIERRETETAAREAKMETDLAALADLQKSNEAVRELEERLQTAERTIRSLNADLRKAAAEQVVMEERIQSLSRSRQRVSAKLKEAEQLLADTTRESASSKREAGRLRRAIASETGKLFAHCPNVQAWISSLTENEPGLNWNEEIVTLGTDPLDTNFFDEVLKEHGYELYKLGSEEAGIMIVGRSGWKLSQLERQIRARTGLDIRIYSQEMALLALALKRDPFDAPEEALEEMGRSHPALSELMDDAFKWPALPRAQPATGGVVIGDWNPHSPLTAMGYHVGREFTSARERRRTLQSIVEEKLIFPAGISAATQREWGEPQSKTRLHRIALQFVQNISLPGRKASHQLAAEHWEDDYKWLREKYGRSVRVGWPRL